VPFGGSGERRLARLAERQIREAQHFRAEPRRCGAPWKPCEIAQGPHTESCQSAREPRVRVDQIDRKSREEALLGRWRNDAHGSRRVHASARCEVGRRARGGDAQHGRKPEAARSLGDGGGEAPLGVEQGRDSRGVQVDGGLGGVGARAPFCQDGARRERERHVEQRTARAAVLRR
jgi:hypothetical protein